MSIHAKCHNTQQNAMCYQVYHLISAYHSVISKETQWNDSVIDTNDILSKAVMAAMFEIKSEFCE